MPSLINSAMAVLSSAQQRIEASAQNIANASTLGYKRQISFAQVIGLAERSDPASSPVNKVIDFRQGRLTETGNPSDFAIEGAGLFLLRDGDRTVYSRGGSFTLNEEGMLADRNGHVLQMAGGGDLTLNSADYKILEDGTVLEAGVPVARVALYQADNASSLSALSGSLFAAEESAMAEDGVSQIRQGFTEASNVMMSDEMVAMMASSRQAESGARILRFYDGLLGQAIATFNRGQS